MNTFFFQQFAALLLGACLIAVTPRAAADPPPRPNSECPNKTKKADRAAGKRVDLNTASVRQIEQIPWVGKKTARAIVDRRKSAGPFQSMDQLLLVRGVGDKTYGCLVLYATVEPIQKSGAGKAP
jgi:competence protein ComEA